ncbi:MAG: MFS transporter [Methanotrichaceae archaeon]|nr:MFS transporter [Methanotrichaceae archaeon]
MPSFKNSGSLASLYLAVFVAVLGFSLIAPFFPRYVMDLGASYSMLGFIVSIYGAVQLLTQIPMGRLSDQVGRKKIMLLGLATFTILPPLYIYAQSVHSLLFIRALGGVGASAVWPIAMALIVDQAEAKNRGAAMGLYNAAFFSALALGPLLGGALYDLMGLNAPFYLWTILGTASFFIVHLKVTEPEKIKVQIGLAAPRGKEALIAPGYRLTFLACSSVVLWTGVVGGFNFTMLPSFAAGLGFNATDVGIIYLVYGGCTALFNIYFGRQADRGTRKKLIFAGCLAGAISFAFLPLASTMIPVAFLFAGLGMGLGMASPAAAALIADTTCVARRGEVYGIFNTARMAGVVTGPLIAGLTADLHGVMGAVYAFTILAIVITLGTLIVRESDELIKTNKK